MYIDVYIHGVSLEPLSLSLSSLNIKNGHMCPLAGLNKLKLECFAEVQLPHFSSALQHAFQLTHIHVSHV